tara:strand:- start:273 stop:620 length:348 start_codon:yes stop_codon:yes gene_type:complete
MIQNLQAQNTHLDMTMNTLMNPTLKEQGPIVEYIFMTLPEEVVAQQVKVPLGAQQVKVPLAQVHQVQVRGRGQVYQVIPTSVRELVLVHWGQEDGLTTKPKPQVLLLLLHQGEKL